MIPRARTVRSIAPALICPERYTWPSRTVPKLSEARLQVRKPSTGARTAANPRTIHLRIPARRIVRILSRSVEPPLARGKRLDQTAIADVRVRPGPREPRHLAPGAFGRPAFMADPVRRMDQAGPMVPGDTMEEDGTPRGVRQQVRRLRHLLQRRPRPAHRHDDPPRAGPTHHLLLVHILGIVAIDGRQRDDRLDPLPPDDPPQGPRPLPCPPDQSPLLDHTNSLLQDLMATGHDHPGRGREKSESQPQSPTLAHSAHLSRPCMTAPTRGRRIDLSLESRANLSGSTSPGNPNPLAPIPMAPPEPRGPFRRTTFGRRSSSDGDRSHARTAENTHESAFTRPGGKATAKGSEKNRPDP